MKKTILIALATVQVILLAVWLVDPTWWHTGRKMVATGQYNTAKYLSSRNVTAFAEDADPNEVNNIFGQPGTEKITKDLKSMLNKYRKDLKVKEY